MSLKQSPVFDAEVWLSVEHADEADEKVFTVEQQVELVQY